MILSAIAAMSRNRVIGINNKLPWDIPEDLKYFREKTKGRVLIMGRKTFESLPFALPGRMHIVITRQKNYQPPSSMKIANKDFVCVSDLQQAIDIAEQVLKPEHPSYRDSYGDEVFVIGGGEIYLQSIPVLRRIYLTVIEKDYNGDAYFPEFDQNQFKVISDIFRQGAPSYRFRIFERI